MLAFNYRIHVIALVALISGGCSSLLDPAEEGNLVPKTVEFDSSLPALDINGTRLRLETYGTIGNPVIIMLHGGPGGAYDDMLRMESLSDDYFLVFFDQRGAGLSKRHNAGAVSMELYRSDINAIMDHFTTSDDEKVILLGHSWGGQLVADILNTSPERVSHAILLDPGPFTSDRFAEMALFEFELSSPVLSNLLWHNELLTPEEHARMDYEYVQGAKDGMSGYNYSESDRALLQRVGYQASQDIIFSNVDNEGNPLFAFNQNLGEYDQMVLFIRGGLNEIHTVEYMEEQMADFPNAYMVEIPDAGHDQIWVESEPVLLAIRDYLDSY